MNKTIKILSLMLFCLLTFASCLNTEEIETTPECVIYKFSVGDIQTNVVVTNAQGKDTTIARSISGSSIKFNIDQVNGIITTVDSIANWIDLSKVCPSFSSSGNVFAKMGSDSLYYVLTSGKDTVNLEKPMDIRVVATNGTSSKRYTLSIKKGSTDSDSYNWKNQSNNFAVKSSFKSLVLGTSVYAFTEGENGETLVTSASAKNNLSSWTALEAVKGADIIYESLVVFNDNFYALSKDGCIYKAADSSNPTEWTKASDGSFTQLLSADKYYIYASDGKEILSSKNLTNWISCGSADIDMLPAKCITSLSYQSRTNADMYISMMNGLTDNNTNNGVSWYKVSSENEDINQEWKYIAVTKDNPYGLPKFKDMSTTIYKGSIYAIGIEPNTDAYKYIYRSFDNGITWQIDKTADAIPSDLNAANGSADIISADGKLWIIQQGGKIWSGSIR